MKLNVLISCMYENDTSIIERSNIQTDAIVVNQCDKDFVEEFDFLNKSGEKCHVKFINTTERGLSRSRNKAIENSWGDICVICDNDEYFNDNYARIIEDAYIKYPNSAIITFQFRYHNGTKPFPKDAKVMSLKDILKTSSQQITFHRNTIINNSILFDEKMGSGTGNGGGEEIKFQNDIRRKGLICMYSPSEIVTLTPSESLWFKGYTKSYFENFGWSTRRAIGALLGALYLFYFTFTHQQLYKNNLSVLSAISSMFKGYFSKR